ncbi:MAG: succinate dehydrogenase iron-sulfur subunit [Actinomycetota bacterium]|nr:succinate dehydrogenase iron-sulfur subunit [Actinomycetota bacterium]MDQ3575745.1 succinate dehydrogenase iron-sulfur subunit [Actinomycetota bacterium]
MDVELKVKRFNPDTDRKPHWQTFTVQAEPTDRVLDALHTVRWDQDGTLGFRRSCAHGVCGSDAMVINGANALACIVLVKDAGGGDGGTITVEPIRGLPVIKDLVVDMEPFFAQYRSVLPYLVNADDPGSTERLQSPDERARYDDTTKCILCAACTTACPIYWGNSRYVGPAAIVNAHRFVFDSRDQAGAERLDILSQRSGVWKCRTAFSCSEACPRGIKVTQAIQEVKRTILFDHS